MRDTHKQEPNSLLIYLYDKTLELKYQEEVPVSIVAPTINRILREVLPTIEVKEPWYHLIPHCVHQRVVFDRAPMPQGETSLLGDRYVVAQEPPPRMTHHPQPHNLFFTVIIKNFQEEIFRGQFSVDDLFHAIVESMARGLMEKGTLSSSDEPIFYKIEVSLKYILSIRQDLFPDQAYQVEGVFRLPKREPKRKRTVFTKVATPPLPIAKRASFGDAELKGRGKKPRCAVLMRPQVYRDLLEISLSDKVEDGGYLLGMPYRTPRSPESEDDPKFKWTVEITDIIRAKGAYGSPALLLFTGDSWSDMRRTVERDYPDRKLVSWFHTHLFAASDSFGLSGLDQDLHRQFFPKPWQVAILVNIDGDRKREVRCFQKGPNVNLLECKFEVLEKEA